MACNVDKFCSQGVNVSKFGHSVPPLSVFLQSSPFHAVAEMTKFVAFLSKVAITELIQTPTFFSSQGLKYMLEKKLVVKK